MENRTEEMQQFVLIELFRAIQLNEKVFTFEIPPKIILNLFWGLG